MQKGKKISQGHIGRPFIGGVENTEGLEDYVPQKRAIGRLFKKVFGKGQY
jgi:hypothetical protein